MKRTLILFIAIIVVFAGCKGSKTEDGEFAGEKEKPEEEGPLMPDFQLENLEGDIVSSEEFEGKVLLIDFWATWCPPCEKAIPALVDMKKELGGEEFEVIGITLDEKRAIPEVKSFIKKYNINYPILLGDEDTKKDFGGIPGIPTMFIVDKDGKIVDKTVGYRDGEEIKLMKKIKEIL
jgi:thiol-disulfide isomerase/thioredoxin